MIFIKIDIQIFEDEQDFDTFLGNTDFDSCGFSADLTPSASGYHAYAISGNRDDLEKIEAQIERHAAGRWLSYRYEQNGTAVLCVEFP